MRNIAIIDESFDSNASSTYHLSVQYSERFCSFAIFDTACQKYLAFKNFWFETPVTGLSQTDHIRKILHGESYLARQYKSASFIYLTPVSVLVPSPLFRKEHPEEYFRYSAHLMPTDKILFRKISAIDAYSVFPVPLAFFNQVRLMLPYVQFFHQSCPLITEALSESADFADKTRVLANINYGFVDLMIVQSNQLLMSNSFKVRSTEDLIFFILYLYEQFGLSQEECPVVLSGFPELFPGSTELLYKYLKNILFRRFPDVFTYSQTFIELKQYQFSPIINLARCE